MSAPLRLVGLADVPLGGLKVYRASLLAPVLMNAGLGAVTLFFAWVTWRAFAIGAEGLLPGLLALFGVLWFALFWAFFAVDLRKALAPQAWLAALADDGLYLKFRSYRNSAWGVAGPQVVFLPYGAIDEAHLLHRTFVTPENAAGRRRWERVASVELVVEGCDTSGLERRVAEERDGRPGGVKQKTIWRDFPVSVEPGGAVRIAWYAHPGKAAFLSELARRGVRVGAPMRKQSDLAAAADPAALEEYARRGDVIGLVRVLRHARGLSLVEAKSEAEALVRSSQAGR